MYLYSLILKYVRFKLVLNIFHNTIISKFYILLLYFAKRLISKYCIFHCV